MVIRHMKIEDKETILRLYHHLSRTYQDNLESLEMALSHPTTEVFVLEENSIVIGTATFSDRVVPSKGLVGYIDDAVVDPPYRGKGFGRQLTIHCINLARQKGCKFVGLSSDPSRIEANGLYKSLGFEKRETNVYVLKL